MISQNLVLEVDLKMAELAGGNYAGGDMLRIAVDNQSAERFTNLQKGGELPIDDLLNMYNYPLRQAAYFAQNCHTTSSPYSCCYGVASTPDNRLSSCLSADNTNETTYSSSEEEILSNQDLTLDKDEIARDLLLSRSEGHDRETSVNDLITVLDMRGSQQDLGNVELPSSQNHPPSAAVDKPISAVVDQEADVSDEEDSENCSTECDDDCAQKNVPVGPEYQAELPNLSNTCRNLGVHDLDEHLLWDPCKLTESAVEVYCSEVARHHHQFRCQREESMMSSGSRVKDNEQALYLLLQCGYDTEEALRRHHMQILPPADPLSLWSSEECANFVSGLRLYGKDFYLIQQNKVKTRSVAELVQFYYLWKRTDQYAAFNSKNFSEKRKSNNITSTPYPGTSASLEVLHAEVAAPISDITDKRSHSVTGCASASPYAHHDSSSSWLPAPDSSMMISYANSHQPAAAFSPPSIYSAICPPEQTSILFNGVSFTSSSASSFVDGFLDPSCYCSPYHSDVVPAPMDYFGSDSLDPPPIKKFCFGSSPASASGSHFITSAEFPGHSSLRGSFEYSPPSASAVSSSLLPFGHANYSCAVSGDSSLGCIEPPSSYLYSDNESTNK